MQVPEKCETTAEFWDRLYRTKERIWSGQVNVRLAEVGLARSASTTSPSRRGVRCL
jgi:hypothetical protein